MTARLPVRSIRLDDSAATLALYDRACAALAAAKSVDEAKQILDASAVMRGYAKQEKISR